MLRFILGVLTICAGLSMSPIAEARGSHGGSRPYYGGGHHTTSHGGSYRGGYGSSHRGGTYSNPKSGNRYGRHK
jgi:hypothetical protein